jgi:hypothetical protein
MKSYLEVVKPAQRGLERRGEMFMRKTFFDHGGNAYYRYGLASAQAMIYFSTNFVIISHLKHLRL